MHDIRVKWLGYLAVAMFSFGLVACEQGASDHADSSGQREGAREADLSPKPPAEDRDTCVGDNGSHGPRHTPAATTDADGAGAIACARQGETDAGENEPRSDTELRDSAEEDPARPRSGLMGLLRIAGHRVRIERHVEALPVRGPMDSEEKLADAFANIVQSAIEEGPRPEPEPSSESDRELMGLHVREIAGPYRLVFSESDRNQVDSDNLPQAVNRLVRGEYSGEALLRFDEDEAYRVILEEGVIVEVKPASDCDGMTTTPANEVE